MRCREMADMRTAADHAERYLEQERGLRTTLGEALRWAHPTALVSCTPPGW